MKGRVEYALSVCFCWPLEACFCACSTSVIKWGPIGAVLYGLFGVTYSMCYPFVMFAMVASSDGDRSKLFVSRKLVIQSVLTVIYGVCTCVCFVLFATQFVPFYRRMLYIRGKLGYRWSAFHF